MESSQTLVCVAGEAIVNGRQVVAAWPAIGGALTFTALAVMIFSGSAWARPWLVVWGVHPFSFPFLDLDTILSALRCLRLGVDVFATNPCDALGRVFDYSPLWLALSVLPVTTAWIVPVGLLIDAAFLASLLLLPAARGRWQAAVLTAGVLSTPVAFALERANNDLIIFVLAAGAAALAVRSFRLRLLAYACAILAGLLKYYPLALLALIARETPRRFVPVALGASLVLLGFVAIEAEDLRRALPLIPVGWYLSNMFGVSTLPLGLVDALGLPASVGRFGLVGLVVLSLGAAMRIGARASVGEDLARLTEGERVFLLTGALLILGCFFSAQNIGYRAVHLLFALPGVTALATVARHRRWYRMGVAVLLALLWAEGWRHWLDALAQGRPPWEELAPRAADAALLLGWLVREGCWWWVVTMLAGLSFSALLSWPMGRAMLPLLAAAARPMPPPAVAR